MIRRSACITALIAAIVSAPALGQPQARTSQQSVVQMGTKPQEILMTKITVSDLLRSYEFYTKVIGMKLVTSTQMKMEQAPTANDPRQFIEIALNFSGSTADPLFLLVKERGKTPTPEMARLTWIGFKVADADAVAKRASMAGYKPPLGRPAIQQSFGFLADPDGYMVEVVQIPSH